MTQNKNDPVARTVGSEWNLYCDRAKIQPTQSMYFAYEAGWIKALEIHPPAISKSDPQNEGRTTLSCGCKTNYSGFPAYWDCESRECKPAISYGLICEKHYQEYDARPDVDKSISQAELEQVRDALWIGEVAQMHFRTSMLAVADIHDARLNQIRAATKLIEDKINGN